MKSNAQNTSAACMSIQELHRQRQDLKQAEVKLTQQIRAICRRLARGDANQADLIYDTISGKSMHPLASTVALSAGVLIDARESIFESRKSLDKLIERAVSTLPIWSRVEATPGLGAQSVGALIGETGCLSNYSTHSKVWKRLGLAVIDGERQRRVIGPLALRHGYSPNRRSVVWLIGECMLRSQSEMRDRRTGAITKAAGPYRIGYDTRKALELERGLPLAHAHNRASRYMQKKLVKNIWRAWNEASTY